jgi:predicted transcriptional regulator of viral defense system
MSDGALSAGLRLLQHVLEVAPAGRVFTSHDAVVAGAELGITREHTYKLLSEMIDRGLLERPRARLYAARPPFGGMLPVRPLAIAVHAVTPAAVSGDTALAHWGFLSQAPLHEEVVSTPARIQWTSDIRMDGGDRLWTVGGATIRFRHVPSREMFGIASVRLDSETVVPMFDRERTVLEVLSRDGEWARELLEEFGRDIDAARLRRYAGRLGVTRPLAIAVPRPARRPGRVLTS